MIVLTNMNETKISEIHFFGDDRLNLLHLYPHFPFLLVNIAPHDLLRREFLIRLGLYYLLHFLRLFFHELAVESLDCTPTLCWVNLQESVQKLQTWVSISGDN